MTTFTPPLREVARAIVLDAGDRILLLRYDENGGFFSAPVKSPGAPVTFGSC
jgi:hypothetical protein